MKKLLIQEEAMIPALFFNLKKALIPLLDDSTYLTMQAVAAAAENRGRKTGNRLPSMKSNRGYQNDNENSNNNDSNNDHDNNDVDNNHDNKRKRRGDGPGLFGSNSNLTNKISTNKNIEKISPEKIPELKKVKTLVSCDDNDNDTYNNDNNDGKNDDHEDDHENDNDENGDENKYSICTNAYCPPCYELA